MTPRTRREQVRGKATWSRQTVFVDGKQVQVLRAVPEEKIGTAVFCHGWGQAPEGYRPLVARLVEDGLEVIAPAFPGYGGSQIVGSPFRSPVTAGAAQVSEAVRALGLDEPVWLVSHSMGAGVAVRIAEDQPDRVRGLVALCPIGQPMEHPMEWIHAAGELRQAAADSSLRDRFAAMLPALLASPVHLVTTGVAAKHHDLRSRYEQIAAAGVRVVVVRADGDTVVRTDRLHHLAGVEVIDVEGRHNLPLLEPVRCADLVASIITD